MAQSGRAAQRGDQRAQRLADDPPGIERGHGGLVKLVRERSRADNSIASLKALGQVRPETPKLLIWDNAPLHHPKPVLAAAAHVTIAWLPYRMPELNPQDDLW